ncbi:hypothetical protein [Sutcliffiella sp. BMC8]|uniref:hypothetical protein n=1 Tax=Sutcliffiella sp. BMC8 TaxID=3073243 RepID=UPI0030D12800
MKPLAMLLLLPTLAMAHSQTPTVYGGKQAPLDAITLDGEKIVPIELTTLGQKPQRYEITINGEFVGETQQIGNNNYVTLPIRVELDEPNKAQEIEICSISIPQDGETYRTRICTIAQLIWKQK